MRLGLVLEKVTFGGGAEKSLRFLAGGLAAGGHEVHVLTTWWEGGSPPGVTLHPVPPPTGPKWQRDANFAWEAKRIMDSLPLDTCLSLGRVPGTPVYRASDGCHAAWLERRSAHVGPLKRLSFKLNPLHRSHLDLERRTLTAPELKRVIANSRMAADELVRYSGLDPAKVTVIPNGVDEERLAPARDPQVRKGVRKKLGLGEAEPMALFVGSGFGRKGLAFALKALARVPGVILVVAGKNRLGPYERLAARLGVGSRVRFLGLSSEVPGLLAAADVLVLPTIYDPLSNACCEALYAGTPVVTTSANGAKELVDLWVNGWVVDDPGDIRGLARGITAALAKGKGAPHRVPSQRQWLDRTLAVLLEAAGKGA